MGGSARRLPFVAVVVAARCCRRRTACLISPVFRGSVSPPSHLLLVCCAVSAACGNRNAFAAAPPLCRRLCARALYPSPPFDRYRFMPLTPLSPATSPTSCACAPGDSCCCPACAIMMGSSSCVSSCVSRAHERPRLVLAFTHLFAVISLPFPSFNPLPQLRIAVPLHIAAACTLLLSFAFLVWAVPVALRRLCFPGCAPRVVLRQLCSVCCAVLKPSLATCE